MSEGEAWWSGHLRWWDDGDDDDDEEEEDEEGEGDDQEDEEEEEKQDDDVGCWRRNVAKETFGKRRDGLATWACQAPEGTMNLQHSKVQNSLQRIDGA